MVHTVLSTWLDFQPLGNINLTLKRFALQLSSLGFRVPIWQGGRKIGIEWWCWIVRGGMTRMTQLGEGGGVRWCQDSHCCCSCCWYFYCYFCCCFYCFYCCCYCFYCYCYCCFCPVQVVVDKPRCKHSLHFLNMCGLPPCSGWVGVTSALHIKQHSNSLDGKFTESSEVYFSTTTRRWKTEKQN